MAKNYIISKGNELVTASYSLSISEQRVILLCLAKIDSRKAVPLDNEFTISVDDFQKETGVTRENAYRDLKSAVSRLYERNILLDINEPDATLRWIYKKIPSRQAGTITISFSEDIMPYISELKERFTSYRLRDVAKFKNSYSIRIYELLSQFKYRNELTVEIKWLRDTLALHGKYPRNIDLKRNVLLPAISEINAYSNISTSIKDLKNGKEISHFVFEYRIKGVENETRKPVKITDKMVKDAARPGESYEQVRDRLTGEFNK
jgi:plasmid replication initiation protein